MNQLFLSAFLFLSILSFSQNQRFYYDYHFQTDSTDVETKKSELMVLDVDKKGSKYYSEYVFQNDSLMNAHFSKNMATHSDEPFPMSGKEGVVTHKILKSYPDFKINHVVSLDMTLYNASQQVKMNWKILPDKKSIGNWSVQKAETDFAGRHWIAWFSADIPVQDGPYKFHGLPGLIVKLEDKSGYYKFELKGIKNNILERNIFAFEWEKPIPIDYKKYQTIYKNYRKDPTANFRRKVSEGELYMTDEAGNKMSGPELIKSQERQALEQMKKNNNVLELDLLK